MPEAESPLRPVEPTAESSPEIKPESTFSVLDSYVNDFEKALDDYDIIKALRIVDAALPLCLVHECDEPLVIMTDRLHYQLRTDLKYEDLIYQQAARYVSDTVLFYINSFARKIPNYQFFAPGRTLLTPHRRRQLMKTMNAEGRVFAMGMNSEHCLGLPAQYDEFVESLTELHMPPVYEIRTSGRHTVFWLHDGRFLGCGFTRNFMIRPGPTYLEQPVELDIYFYVRKHETVCGFKALDYGTLFETDLRWYFVGDYPKSQAYLKTIYNHVFEPLNKNTSAPNFWVCHSRPHQSIMISRLDDPKNVAPMKFKSSVKMIRVYPNFWTELSPGFTARRPILFLLNGIEISDLRIENIRSGVVWVTYVGTLYNGLMHLLMHEENDGDEENLDNYILFVELSEYRTPTPFVVSSVATFDDSVIVKCGDFPFVSFDHVAIREDRYRGGNVQKFMFEAVEKYMETPKNREEYNPEDKEFVTENLTDFEKEYTIRGVIRQAEIIIDSGQLDHILKLDVFNRLTPNYRYANYFGFLCYASMPRLPGFPPKFFDTDLDEMTTRMDPKAVARNRMKLLFEEFERVNYPGTDVWKPTEFLRSYPEPEDDTSSEAMYRTDAMNWCFQNFLEKMKIDSNLQEYDFTEEVNQEVVHYIVQVLYYTSDLWRTFCNGEPSEAQQFLLDDAEYFEKRVPDREPFFKCMDPGAIVESRIADGYLTEGDFTAQTDVTVKFRLRHRDPKLEDTLYEVKSYASLIYAQNSFLHKFIENGVLDLNKVYPDDTRLHRLIVQTHFMGHGLTDLTDVFQYEQSHIFKLGWHTVRAQSYLEKGRRRTRGYLFPICSGLSGSTLVSAEPNERLDVVITCSCGSLVYCHYLIRTLWSLLPDDTPLPATIPLPFMMNALRGIYDRRVIEVLPMSQRIVILDWYEQAEMPEAFEDLLKQCVVDATSKDTNSIRHLLALYPNMTRRFIAEYRPGILLWLHCPVPEPRLEHIKIITEMWPKNEYERSTRLPRVSKNGEKHKSLFRCLGSRQLRSWYMNGEEKERPMFGEYYLRDFPTPGSEEELVLGFRPDYYEDDDDDEDEEEEELVVLPVTMGETVKQRMKDRKEERRRRRRQEMAATSGSSHDANGTETNDTESTDQADEASDSTS